MVNMWFFEVSAALWKCTHLNPEACHDFFGRANALEEKAEKTYCAQLLHLIPLKNLFRFYNGGLRRQYLRS